MPTYGKSHDQRSLQFDSAGQVAFDTVGSVSASTAVTTVQALLPLALDTKVMHVAVAATAISGSPAIQIVYGTGTPGTVGATDTPAVAGTTVFTAPVSVTVAAGVTQVIYPPVYDTVYQGSNPSAGVTGLPLTLRVVTGSGDTASNLKVMIGGKPVDSGATTTELPSPDGNYGFDMSTF